MQLWDVQKNKSANCTVWTWAPIRFLSEEIFRDANWEPSEGNGCECESVFFFFFLKLHHFLFASCYLNSRHTHAIITSEAHKPPLWHQWQSLRAIGTEPTMTEGFLPSSWCHRMPWGRFVVFIFQFCCFPAWNLTAVSRWPSLTFELSLSGFTVIESSVPKPLMLHQFRQSCQHTHAHAHNHLMISSCDNITGLKQDLRPSCCCCYWGQYFISVIFLSGFTLKTITFQLLIYII